MMALTITVSILRDFANIVIVIVIVIVDVTNIVTDIARKVTDIARKTSSENYCHKNIVIKNICQHQSQHK